MAEENDDSQKTEEASQRKLEEARGKGQVALSREVVNWAMVLAISGIVMVWAPGAARQIEQALLPFIEQAHLIRLDGSFANAAMTHISDVVLVLLPALGLTLFAAIAGTVIQTGVLFAGDRIHARLDHISPLRGIERLFSIRSVIEFLKGLAKVILVGVIAFWLLMPEVDRMFLLPTLELSDAVMELYEAVRRLVLGIAVALTGVALLDYIYQRLAFLRSMRMSKQEVREEHKQVEGDPHIKGKLKQLRAQRARRRMMAAVPNAAVVVTNPTHFAIALEYEMGKSRAPKVVAKGADRVAQRIREVAGEHGVPVVENPPLARTLYAAVEIDQEIPPEHYKAVAEIIGYVLRLQGKMAARRAHQ
jgi:flagellar biosynthetic protein FlhB